MSRALVVATIAVLAAMPVAAQMRWEVREGQRVRVRYLQPVGRRITLVGIVTGADADSVHLTTPDGINRSLALGRVGRVERSLGRRQDFGGVFLKTVVTSALVSGVAIGLLVATCDDADFLCGDSDFLDGFAGGALLGAMAGVPIGIIAGAVSRPERWVPAVTVRPSDPGAIGFRWAVPVSR